MSSMSTRASLNNEMLSRLSIVLPPLATQQAIGSKLKAFDDKIDLNRRMNATLEAMARALFQAWFVDFEPAQRVAMGPFGSNIKTDNFVPEGVPVIRGGNLTDGFVDDCFVFLTEEKADELRNSNAYPGDVVITHRGTLGQVGLIPRSPRFKRYVVSQSQMLVRADSERLQPHYLYLFLTSSAGQNALLANRSQTGVPAIAQPTASVKAIKLVCPPMSVLRRFEELVAVLLDACANNNAESRTLAAMRNALLPKLMSGEVRVRP